MIYAIATIDLNLQKDCFRIHAIEAAYSLALLVQAIDRVCKLSNSSTVVHLSKYTIKSIFDDKAMTRNIDKAISQTMAKLNRQIFQRRDFDRYDFVDLDEWVEHEEKLWSHQKIIQRFDKQFQILSTHDVLMTILKRAKSETIIVSRWSQIAKRSCWWRANMIAQWDTILIVEEIATSFMLWRLLQSLTLKSEAVSISDSKLHFLYVSVIALYASCCSQETASVRSYFWSLVHRARYILWRWFAVSWQVKINQYEHYVSARSC